MKKANFSNRRQFLQGEKRLEKKHIWLIYLFGIIAAAYYFFIEPTTIGHDRRYLIYIFLLPTIFGMIVLGIYRREFLVNRFSQNKGFILWTFMLVFYLGQGFIFSYISFGQAAKMGWDYVNYRATQENQEETLICPVADFRTGKRQDYIDFKFNGKYESLKVSYSTFRDYQGKNPNDYFLRINATKGLWSYYTVNGWTIEYK